jgi:SAM-dependent methyltransferase
VLDVGGGPGRYADWLASAGYSVHLLDPAPVHVREARRRAGDPPRFRVDRGDARVLPVADDSADAVLLLGPLYHLSSRDDRLQALREAVRVCRPAGVVAAAAICRFAPMLHGMRDGWLVDERVLANTQDEVATGRRVAPHRRMTAFPDAYFHLPHELRAEAADAGVDVVDVFGVEGPGWLWPDIDDRLRDPRMRERILWLARTAEREPYLLAASAHLLLIGRGRVPSAAGASAGVAERGGDPGDRAQQG